MSRLHDDQERYAESIAARTGLQRDVLRAWVGAVSGAGVYRAHHDYLAAGAFPDVERAAAHAAELAERAGLVPLNVLGPLPQLVAIGQHPSLPGTVDGLFDAWATQ